MMIVKFHMDSHFSHDLKGDTLANHYFWHPFVEFRGCRFVMTIPVIRSPLILILPDHHGNPKGPDPGPNATCFPQEIAGPHVRPY